MYAASNLSRYVRALRLRCLPMAISAAEFFFDSLESSRSEVVEEGRGSGGSDNCQLSLELLVGQEKRWGQEVVIGDTGLGARSGSPCGKGEGSPLLG